MPTAYSYCRMSTIVQALRGESAKRQLASTRAYCEKNGLVLDESFRLQDSGVSAFRSKNAKIGNLGMFLEGVESGRIPSGCVLIVESLDRLTRDDLDVALQLFLRIIGAGVDIVTLTPERRHTRDSIKDIVGLIEPILIMSRANEESSIKSERVMKDWAKRRKESRETGRIVGKNTCPWWLSLEDGKFVEIPDRVALVRQVFDWKEEGVGIHHIAARLNASDSVPRPKSNTHWANPALATLIRNRMVLGEYQPHRIVEGRRVPDGVPIEGYYPPIISTDQFHQVQAITRAKTHMGRKPKDGIINCFSGLLRNGNDSHPVYLYSSTHNRKSKKGIKTFVYQCLYSVGCFNSVPGADRSRVNFFPFEHAFFKFVRELDPKDFAKVGTNHDAVAVASGDLADIEHQIKTIKNRMKGAKEIDHYLDLLDEREAERKALVVEIERLKAQGSAHEVDIIGEVRGLVDLLANATSHDEKTGEATAQSLRQKIKVRVSQIVERITMFPDVKRERRGPSRTLMYDVTVWVDFRNGTSRVYRCDQDGNLSPANGVNLIGKREQTGGKAMLRIPTGEPQEMPTGKFDIQVDPDDPEVFWLVPTDEPPDDQEGGLSVAIGTVD